MNLSASLWMVAPRQTGKTTDKNATPYSQGPSPPWTCVPAEHPNHHGLAPMQTLLIVDLPHRGTTYSKGHSPPRNPLLTVDLHHRGKSYSPWTCQNAEHPTHLGTSPLQKTHLTVTCLTANYQTHRVPASPQNTLLTLELPHIELPTH